MNCPHGDETCPCQDNGRIERAGFVNQDPCHYEGENAMRCPNPPFPEAEPGGHCHVEGCRWNMTGEDGCGLAKIMGRSAPDNDRRCGSVRFVDALMLEGAW